MPTKRNPTFMTARGAQISLQFEAMWRTPFPALDGINLTSYIQEDDRFEYLGKKKIWLDAVVPIDHYHVKIREEGLHKDKRCCLTAVTHLDETVEGDLEPQRSVRTVLVPEKCDECEIDHQSRTSGRF